MILMLLKRLEGDIHKFVETMGRQSGDFFVVVKESMGLVSVRVAGS